MSKFNQYLSQLKKLSTEKTLLTHAHSILLLSGSSHYDHASLTEQQQNFLAEFQVAGYQLVPSNFPYNTDFAYDKQQFPSLFRASLSNIEYYCHTLWSRNFREEVVRHLQPVFELEDIIIVTQSSGLNLLTQVLPFVSIPDDLQVFALGPVSYQKIQLKNCLIIKGRHDYYSRFLDQHSADQLVACGHHNYLISTEVKEVIHESISKN